VHTGGDHGLAQRTPLSRKAADDFAVLRGQPSHEGGSGLGIEPRDRVALAKSQALKIDIGRIHLDDEQSRAQAVPLGNILAGAEDEAGRRLLRTQRGVRPHPKTPCVIPLRPQQTISVAMQTLDIARSPSWGEIIDDQECVLCAKSYRFKSVRGARP
jgi:hypothetical protein